MIESIVGALAATGVIAGAIVGIVRWAAHHVAQRLDHGVRHSYEKLIEHERAQLQVLTQLSASVASIPSSGFVAGYQQRLRAIEQMWTSLLDVRRRYGRAVEVYDSLMERELLALQPSNPVVAGVESSTDAFLAKNTEFPECEEVRPLLGEVIWSRYAVFRAVHMRLAFKLADGLSGGEVLPWDKGFHGDDDPVVRALGTVIPEDQLTEARHRPVGGLGSMLETIQAEILAESSRILSGSEAATQAIAQTQMVAMSLRDMKSSMQPVA